jgi:prevent-host-death family protein
MDPVNIHAAKTQFSKLLARVERGEEVVISRSGKPVAKLVPFEMPNRRILGGMKGLFTVPDDFDAPLPGEVQRSFEE